MFTGSIPVEATLETLKENQMKKHKVIEKERITTTYKKIRKSIPLMNNKQLYDTLMIYANSSDDNCHDSVEHAEANECMELDILCRNEIEKRLKDWLEK